jgi:hypothetical protein
LLDELSTNLSPWAKQRQDIFDQFEQKAYEIEEFFSFCYQKDYDRFAKTHTMVLSLLKQPSTNKEVLHQEKLIRRLLQKAERAFVALFTYLGTFAFDKKEGYLQVKRETIDFLGQLNDQMTQTVASLKGTHGSILQAMVEVQNQDIMRQSINHAIMSVDEFDCNDLDDELECVTFKIDLLELALSVVTEVRMITTTLQNSFNSHLDAVDEELKAITAQKHCLADSLMQYTEDPLSAIKELRAFFLKGNEFYKHYLVLRTKIIRAHRLVLNQAQKAVENSLEKDGAIFKQIFEIEATLVYDMAEDLTDHLELFVRLKEKFLLELDQIITTYNEMSDTIIKEQVFSQKVSEQLEQVNQDTANMDNLLVLLDESKADLIKNSKLLWETQQQLLRARGLSSWKLQSDKITQLAAKFTILSHKKTAGEIVGFNLQEEVGADDGEFILF